MSHTRIYDGNMTAYLQHRSDDYRTFSLEIVGHAHGKNTGRTLTATVSPARRVAWYTACTTHLDSAPQGIWQARAQVRTPHWHRPARAEGDPGE